MITRWCGGRTVFPGMTWVCVSRCWHTCRDSSRVPKRLATVIISWPSAWTTAGGKREAVLLGQLGINLLPLGLEEAPEDGVGGGVGGAFQIIEGGLRLQHGDISLGEVEGSEFSHRRARGIVHAADQHADVTDGDLLGQCGGPMVPHVGVIPGRSLSQRLFALTIMVRDNGTLPAPVY